MKLSRILVLLLIMVVLDSCYHHNIFSRYQENSLADLLRSDDDYEYLIGLDDKLSFSLWNHENMSVGSVFGLKEINNRGVLVDVNGNVMLPKIGKVPLLGLTINQAVDKLTNLYGSFLVNPIIVIKVLNREISILGEVRNPGNYILEKQTNTLTEIIASANGFDFYADKRKVLLLRNNKGYKIDFTVLEDNNYQIIVQDGDVISIPSTGDKVLYKKTPLFTGLTTAIILVLSLF